MWRSRARILFCYKFTHWFIKLYFVLSTQSEKRTDWTKSFSFLFIFFKQHCIWEEGKKQLLVYAYHVALPFFFSPSSNSVGRSFYHSLSVLPEARFRRDLDTSRVELFFLLLLFVWGSFLWPIESIFWREGSQQRVFCTKVEEECDISENNEQFVRVINCGIFT